VLASYSYYKTTNSSTRARHYEDGARFFKPAQRRKETRTIGRFRMVGGPCYLSSKVDRLSGTCMCCVIMDFVPSILHFKLTNRAASYKTTQIVVTCIILSLTTVDSTIVISRDDIGLGILRRCIDSSCLSQVSYKACQTSAF
jgi:hypothetical protein